MRAHQKRDKEVRTGSMAWQNHGIFRDFCYAAQLSLSYTARFSELLQSYSTFDEALMYLCVYMYNERPNTLMYRLAVRQGT